MDQGRSLVLLSPDDPAAYSVPLMGVWAAGVDCVRSPLVAAACLKFLCSRALGDKAVEADAAFLVLVYAAVSWVGGQPPVEGLLWHEEQWPLAATGGHAGCCYGLHVTFLHVPAGQGHGAALLRVPCGVRGRRGASQAPGLLGDSACSLSTGPAAHPLQPGPHARPAAARLPGIPCAPAAGGGAGGRSGGLARAGKQPTQRLAVH